MRQTLKFGLRSWLQVLILAATTALLVVVATPSAAMAQLPSIPSLNSSPSLPAGVQRVGNLEVTSITLDGKGLFKIASPAVFDRTTPTSVPVEARARQVEANLQRLIPRGISEQPVLNPETLEVIIERVEGYPVLFAQDANTSEPRVLLTATDADAQYYSRSKEQVAEQWQEILQEELRQAIELRQPEARRQQILRVVRALMAVVVLSLVLGAGWAFLGKREKVLTHRHAAESALIRTQEYPAIETPEAEPGLRLLEGLKQHLGLRRRLQIVQFFRWLLFWSLAFLWASGLAYSFYTFPQTRGIARNLIVVPIVLLVAWFVIGLVNRLIDLTVDRLMQNLAEDLSLTPANLQRITTITKVIKGFKMVLVYSIGVLWVLQGLDLIPGSLLALGTAIALVLSFAAQSLVRDLVNGFMILLEDQFRIGDFVRIGASAGLQEVSGLVENLNLRITQIRSTEGNLITFANSSIVQVENMSRTWARADFYIEVAYETDVNQALTIIRDTADKMAQDPQWRSLIMDSHELLGVEQLSHTGIMIRLWIKTEPLQQWNVARELRRRLKMAFDQSEIRIGIPQQIWLKDPLSR
jgi:small conductance mechanosensitive channel